MIMLSVCRKLPQNIFVSGKRDKGFLLGRREFPDYHVEPIGSLSYNTASMLSDDEYSFEAVASTYISSYEAKRV